MRRLPVSPARAALGIGLAILVTLGVSGVSRVPTPIHAEDEAVIRLSWRLTGASRTTCRPISQEAQSELPVHMRRLEECDERPPEYRLLVRLEGEVIEDRVIRGRGARGDRPLVVYREIPIRPGPAHLEIEFVPVADDPELPALRFRESLDARPRGVVLVTLDPNTRTLTGRTGAGTPPPRNPE
jgi:hypothetical protein